MKVHRLGFTLIELLIVVAIIGILAAIAIPNFLEAQTRAKVASQNSNLRSITIALEEYQVDNSQYPPWFMLFDPFPGEPANARFPYVYITTPIPYLSSNESLVDQFHSSDHPKFRTRYQWHRMAGMPGTSCLTYPPTGCSADSFVGRSQTFTSCGPFKGIATWGNSYGLWGTGPTGRSLGAGICASHPLADVPYDPSNGTVSNGHIYRFGP